MNKRMLLIPALVVLVGTTLLATDKIDAMGWGGGDETLIQLLAERLGKNEDEVQVVFDEYHQERMQEMHSFFEERLNEEVADGTITEEQKQLILAKHQEIQTIHEDMRDELQDMTPEERRTTMQAQHDEMEAWAEENGIDVEQLRLGFGPGEGMRGMHRGVGMGMGYQLQLDQE